MNAGPYDNYQYLKGNYVNQIFFISVIIIIVIIIIIIIIII